MRQITILIFSFIALLSFHVVALANETQLTVVNQVPQKISVTIKEDKDTSQQSIKQDVLGQQTSQIPVLYEKYIVSVCVPSSGGACTASTTCPPDVKSPTQITAAYSADKQLTVSCS